MSYSYNLRKLPHRPTTFTYEKRLTLKSRPKIVVEVTVTGKKDDQGRRQGKVTYTDHQGYVVQERHFKDGLSDGLYIVYHPQSAQPALIGQYYQGHRIGIWIAYETDGTERRQVEY